ncbi:MAG: DUF4157 domain-containing protein [Candidatus Angelobacter sp.]
MMKAEQIPGQSGGRTTFSASVPRARILQRKCGCGDASNSGTECEECKKKKLQRRAAAPGPATAPPIVHEVLSSPGQSLDQGTRTFFEPRFGHDFGKVRIHTDEKAAESARAVNALAYTVGRDLVFNQGQFAPTSDSGRQLLAHELTHVVQQSASTGHPSRSSLEIGAEGDFAESQAERNASSIVGFSSSLPLARHAGIRKLQRQVGSGTDDQSKKPTKPLIPIGDDWSFDPKLNTPLGSGSLEDAHKAYDSLTNKEKPKDLTCPIGWVKMRDGRCCEGKADATGSTVNLTKCCAPSQLTAMGVCCPPDQTAEKLGCKKNPLPTPQMPGPKPPTTAPQGGPFQLQPPSAPVRFGTIESETLDNFDLNSPRVPSGNKDRLDHLASLLNIYREVEVHIEGHTDGSGTEAINKSLSNARAEEVKAQLIRRHVINPGRLKTEGFSATQPVVPPQSPTAVEPKNRRVDVWYHIPPSEPGLRSKVNP